MGKKRKSKKQVKSICNTGEQFEKLNQLSKEEIIEAIVEANRIITENKEQSEMKRQQDDKAQWQKAIGAKDYSEEKCCLKKGMLNFISDIKIFFKIMFLHKNEVPEGKIIIIIIGMLCSAFFKILEISCYAICVGIVAIVFRDNMKLEQIFTCIIMVVSIFFIGRFFRLAAIEADKTKRQDYLMSVFSIIITTIALAVSVISIFINFI